MAFDRRAAAKLLFDLKLLQARQQQELQEQKRQQSIVHTLLSSLTAPVSPQFMPSLPSLAYERPTWVHTFLHTPHAHALRGKRVQLVLKHGGVPQYVKDVLNLAPQPLTFWVAHVHHKSQPPQRKSCGYVFTLRLDKQEDACWIKTIYSQSQQYIKNYPWVSLARHEIIITKEGALVEL